MQKATKIWYFVGVCCTSVACVYIPKRSHDYNRIFTGMERRNMNVSGCFATTTKALVKNEMTTTAKNFAVHWTIAQMQKLPPQHNKKHLITISSIINPFLWTWSSGLRRSSNLVLYHFCNPVQRPQLQLQLVCAFATVYPSIDIHAIHLRISAM